MSLRDIPVLQVMNGLLRPPQSLRILSEEHRDQHGKPLFEDLYPWWYLSDNYSKKDHDLIRALGSSDLNLEDFLRVVQARESCISDGKSCVTWDNKDWDWHERFSTLLIKCIDSEDDSLRDGVMNLFLLATASGWDKARGNKLFFPLSDGKEPPIPNDLGFYLLRIMNAGPKRKELFEKLGVQNCPAQQVVKAITAKYKTSSFSGLKIDESLSHILFLFHHLPKDCSAPDGSIFLLNENEEPMYRSEPLMSGYVYLRHADTIPPKYHAAELFASDELNGVPAFSAHFLHPDYLTKMASDKQDPAKRFQRWLNHHMGVRPLPALLKPFTPKLSPEIAYLMAHKPAKFVSILSEYSISYGSQVREAQAELRQTPVRISGGLMKELSATFLPLPQLRTTIERLGIKNFPFLDVDEVVEETSSSDWTILLQLGVGLEKDLQFYLQALECIYNMEKILTSNDSWDILSALCTVYSEIIRCHGPEDEPKIR